MNHKNNSTTGICLVCGQEKNAKDLVPAALIRPAITELIQKMCPDWTNASFICTADLDRFRSDYVQRILEDEQHELSILELKVITSLREEELLSRNINIEFERKLTFGERVADRVATLGGSWSFIIGFFLALGVWILINSLILFWRPFDPYPFILLNLCLSCLAAIQAPIIMMSQNRQEAKDRLRSEHDYQVNLKAELEIRHLNEKIDHLLNHQWQRLLEIQQLQMELMEEGNKRGNKNT